MISSNRAGFDTALLQTNSSSVVAKICNQFFQLKAGYKANLP